MVSGGVSLVVTVNKNAHPGDRKAVRDTLVNAIPVRMGSVESIVLIGVQRMTLTHCLHL